jgi:hypothetical protein
VPWWRAPEAASPLAIAKTRCAVTRDTNRRRPHVQSGGWLDRSSVPRTGFAAMTEVPPFEDAPAAYERMMSGEARFRVVLDMQAERP